MKTEVLIGYATGILYNLSVCIKREKNHPKLIASCVMVHTDLLDKHGNTIEPGGNYLLNAAHTFMKAKNNKLYIYSPKGLLEIPKEFTLIDQELDIAVTPLGNIFNMQEYAGLQIQPLQELPNKEQFLTLKQILVLQGFPASRQKIFSDRQERELRDYPVAEIAPPEGEDDNHNYIYAEFNHLDEQGIPSPIGISGGGTRRGYYLPNGVLCYEFAGINIAYKQSKNYVKCLKRETIAEFISNHQEELKKLSI